MQPPAFRGIPAGMRSLYGSSSEAHPRKADRECHLLSLLKNFPEELISEKDVP